MDYTKLASDENLDHAVKALASKNISAVIVKDKARALEKIKELIPAGASVMNGASVTLEQIGFIDYLKSGNHSWNNQHAAILAEKDPQQQLFLRKQAVLADYYLGSVHALTENGEFVVASNTGSQLPHIVYTSPNLIFVVSAKKIVPNLVEAMRRLEEHVVPLENEHMQKLYGTGTSLNKILVFKNENPSLGRKIQMILVQEDLGF
ncbi:MAG: lactate utilization protein [Patescibacteria group bacterium]|nr:lactate utilization protein [Patescibacteria group bacterium]